MKKFTSFPSKGLTALVVFVLLNFHLNAQQQSVSIGTNTIKPNAVLYLHSENQNQALIIPIVNGTGAVNSPEPGMVVYDATGQKLYYRNNVTWIEVGGTGPGGTITLGGDLSGSPNLANIARLQGKTVSAANPSNGQILKFNGTTQTWELADGAATTYTAGTGIAINGSNQIGIANDGVTSAQIAANTITNADLNKTSIPLSGFGAATTNVDLGNQKIVNLGTPTVNTDAATKAYVDAADNTKLNSTILTTSGDLLFHNGTAINRLPRGSNGQVLLSTASGIQWGNAGLTNPMSAPGDLIVGGSGGAPTRLGGTAGFLKSTGAVAPTWSAINLASTDVSGTLPLTSGGTGATTVTAARTNLGLGTLATLNGVSSTEITDGTITNADVSLTAAIAGTKISPNFGTQNIGTTGNAGIGIASPSTRLHVRSSTTTATPLAYIDQTSTGDASMAFLTSSQDYTMGVDASSSGNFKISNSTTLGTNDLVEITPTGTTAVTKFYCGTRGQEGVHILSTDPWGTSLHISNGASTSTGAGYSMTVTGASGPTGQANDFALIASILPVFTIGSVSGQYRANFPVGYLGVGRDATTHAFEVEGNAGKTAGGVNWASVSDFRLKKDISSYTDGLDLIRKINPVWFKYNGKGGMPVSKDFEVGVIAQEMKEIAPYTVSTFKAKYDENSVQDEEYYEFNFNAINFAMINALKELDKRVTELEQENDSLRHQLKDVVPRPPDENDSSQQLKAELEAQKSRTDQLEAELNELKKLLYMEANSSDKE